MGNGTTSKSDDADLQFRGYVVAVVDVLGQKEAIRKLSSFRVAEAERASIVDALKESIGTRNGVADIFTLSFAQFDKPPADPRFSSMTHEQQQIFKRFKHFQTRTYQFSDTLVAYSPLMTQLSEPSVHDLYAILCAAGMTMQSCSAAKTPLRGGIELGWGIEWGSEIYGPAFLHAYELSEHVAQHPRIVIGNEFLSYLRSLCNDSPTTTLDRIRIQLAKTCLSLLSRDDDGVFIVDYLGEGALAIFGKETSRQVVSEGLAFAKHEHERFVAQGNLKLAERYAKLLRYYESNVGRWS